MYLSHGIDAIQGVGLDVEDVVEAVRMMFFVDAGDRLSGPMYALRSDGVRVVPVA